MRNSDRQQTGKWRMVEAARDINADCPLPGVFFDRYMDLSAHRVPISGLWEWWREPQFRCKLGTTRESLRAKAAGCEGGNADTQAGTAARSAFKTRND
jgi:hypothetical protein